MNQFINLNRISIKFFLLKKIYILLWIYIFPQIYIIPTFLNQGLIIISPVTYREQLAQKKRKKKKDFKRERIWSLFIIRACPLHTYILQTLFTKGVQLRLLLLEDLHILQLFVHGQSTLARAPRLFPLLLHRGRRFAISFGPGLVLLQKLLLLALYGTNITLNYSEKKKERKRNDESAGAIPPGYWSRRYYSPARPWCLSPDSSRGGPVGRRRTLSAESKVKRQLDRVQDGGKF